MISAARQAALADTARAGAGKAAGAAATAQLQDVDSVYRMPDVDDIDNYLNGVIKEARRPPASPSRPR